MKFNYVTPDKNWIKKVFFYCLSVAIVLLLMEIFSYIAYYLIEKEQYSYSKIRLDRLEIAFAGANAVPNNRFDGIEVIHPYLGYVHNPFNKDIIGVTDNKEFQKRGIRVTKYGFVDDKSPIQKKSEDKVIVGVFGGSVAMYFTVYGIDFLIKEIKKEAVFSDKNIEIVGMGVSGYKQPQQLMALNYLLVLGAEFDIIVNIDGFNEVALPYASNRPKKVFPFFPRRWFSRVDIISDVNILSLFGEIAYFKKRKSSWAFIFARAPLRYSVTLNLVWKTYNTYIDKIIAENQRAILNGEATKIKYIATGLPYPYGDDSRLFFDLAELWKRSSVQMDKLAKMNGATYFHFLQPNQYVNNSKQFSKEEKRKYIKADNPYKTGPKVDILICKVRDGSLNNLVSNFMI